MVNPMTQSKNNPYVDCTITFPEPWAAIRRPGVRLCLGDPVEVITAVSRYCIPVFTLYIDNKLTKLVQSYASYFHKIKGNNEPDVSVSYLSVPRFILALRVEPTFRALVLASPLSISEG